MSPRDKQKLNGITEGAEPNQNAFSKVTVNGKQANASEKTDNFNVAAGENVTLTLDDSTKTLTIASKDTTYSVATSGQDGLMSSDDKSKLINIEAQAQVNKIEKITVNGQEQTPNNKTVAITIPTDLSGFTNSPGYITAEDAVFDDYVTDDDLSSELAKYLKKDGSVALTGNLSAGSHKITNLLAGTDDTDAATVKQINDAIKGLGTVLNFKGSKASYSALPSSNTLGDAWYVEDEQAEYVWIEDSSKTKRWEKLGPAIDLSGYVTKAGLATETGTATNNAMTQKAVTDALNEKQDTITGAATSIVSDDLTINKALISNAEGKVAASTVSSTELGYLAGVTSKIQTQLDAKLNEADLEAQIVKKATGTINTTGSLSTKISYRGTLLNVLTKDGNGEIVLCDVTSTDTEVTVSVSRAPATQITAIVSYI